MFTREPGNCFRKFVPRFIKQLLAGLRWAEDALLALLLGAMICVAASQVVLRNFFDSGLYWGDSAVRVMVLWVAMFGAMVASRRDEHIRIDIVSRFASAWLQPHLVRVTSLFTCFVLLLFAWASFEFVQYEYEDQTIAFGQVPAWACEAVMPFGAAVMAVRYALHTLWPPR